jgi:hypothetical protein
MTRPFFPHLHSQGDFLVPLSCGKCSRSHIRDANPWARPGQPVIIERQTPIALGDKGKSVENG